MLGRSVRVEDSWVGFHQQGLLGSEARPRGLLGLVDQRSAWIQVCLKLWI